MWWVYQWVWYSVVGAGLLAGKGEGETVNVCGEVLNTKLDCGFELEESDKYCL